MSVECLFSMPLLQVRRDGARGGGRDRRLPLHVHAAVRGAVQDHRQAGQAPHHGGALQLDLSLACVQSAKVRALDLTSRWLVYKALPALDLTPRRPVFKAPRFQRLIAFVFTTIIEPQGTHMVCVNQPPP